MQEAATARGRLDAIDLVRGFVMVVMMLDHVRDLTHSQGFTGDPLNPATTTPLLYFTRWITHLCAPTFVFLAGLSVGIQRLRGKPVPELRHLLWTRGAWLVFLELTLVRVVIWWNVHPSMLAFLQVIWAIGGSMLLLAPFVRLSPRVPLALGLGVVLGHNLLDRFQVPPFQGPASPVPSALGQLWLLLHQGGLYPVAAFPSPMVCAFYPLLPWAGVLFTGYGVAGIYGWASARRRRALTLAGIAMAVVFGVLRYSNLYGDPRPWGAQPDLTKTAMDFMNVAKYPPSLLFVLATLSPALIGLAALDGRELAGRVSRWLVTFGRVPFFFYFLQWIWAHLAGMTVSAVQGKNLAPYFQNLVQIAFGPPPDIGGPLWSVSLCWGLGAVLLYPACRWFAGVKALRRDWWLSYV